VTTTRVATARTAAELRDDPPGHRGRGEVRTGREDIPRWVTMYIGRNTRMAAIGLTNLGE
jgi:hypothetical protein